VFTYSDSTGGSTPHSVVISVSAAYLGGSSVTVAMPDFSGLAGFLVSWMPASAQTVTWFVQATGYDLNGSGVPAVTNFCQEGLRVLQYTLSGSN